MSYISIPDLRDVVGNDPPTATLQLAIEAACRWVDGQTRGVDGVFVATTDTRHFTAEWSDYLEIDDLVSIDSLKTDEDGDRVYETTWLATDYDLEPYRGTPKTAIRIAPSGTRGFPTIRRGVEIVGLWGYAAEVPALIRQITLAVARAQYEAVARDQSVVSEKFGDLSVTYGQTSGGSGGGSAVGTVGQLLGQFRRRRLLAV